MKEVDRQALVDICRVIERAMGFPINSLQALEQTDYLQDALIRCLEVLGEAVKRLSLELRQRSPEIPWRGMAGMRDLLIHAYDRVDLEEVWLAYLQLPDIREKVLCLLQQDLEESSPG